MASAEATGSGQAVRVRIEPPDGAGSDGVAVVGLGDATGAIDAFHHAGGVVEYALIWVPDGLPERDAHRAAALVAVHELTSRSPTDRWRTDPQRAVGTSISVEDFVGPFYDWERERLLSAWIIGEHGGGHRIGHHRGEFVTAGYADAFSDPAYPLTTDLEQASAWFTAINRALFGGLRRDLEVVRWSIDWSSWFDPGLEWWGAFLWTVRHRSAPTITVISAVSTD